MTEDNSWCGNGSCSHPPWAHRATKSRTKARLCCPHVVCLVYLQSHSGWTLQRYRNHEVMSSHLAYLVPLKLSYCLKPAVTLDSNNYRPTLEGGSYPWVRPKPGPGTKNHVVVPSSNKGFLGHIAEPELRD